MYAIVEIAGQQYKVQKDQQLFVHRLEGKEGSKVTFDNVLLTANGDKIEVGAPAVKGVSVSAKIIEHLKGDKVIVFKKKRRKGYAVKNGHRQQFSKIEIEKIGAVAKTATKKAVETASVKEEKVEVKDTKPKTAAKKPAVKKTTTAKASTTAAKKATTKKPATKAAAKPKTASKAKTAAKPAAKKTTTKAKKAAPKKDSKKEDK